ncbi:MAG TPA: flagellar biosynthesis protein FlhA [Deltaproteobacteria bacterium]|nr:flagellar biosynthesis protein FlhA [Deltaproteobacteria bacterium]
MLQWLDWLRSHGDALLAVGVFGLLGIMVVPLPPVLLDLLLAASICLALLLFLGALYATKAVEFSVFPTLLLVTTVFRLALNVASTRLILLHGGDGSQAAGRIIETFGQFVVGGNFIVGAVVFTILVLINFVVITKGSGRIAEVAARFTLDAMPGKQMAVDAELNAGLIDERTARSRRSEISREADFYGAMDGASKFIRGDAIAGIVITLVNVCGGVLIGAFQQGMALGDAAATYTILTIGDGLAGQVPALIVSTAAGLLVTRVDDEHSQDLHAQISSQLLENPRVLGVGAMLLAGIALIPGLRMPFIVAAVAVGALAWQVRNAPPVTEPPPRPSPEPSDARPEDLLPIEPLTVEVAVDLVYLVDDRQGGELLKRIQKMRTQFAKDAGLVLPPVHLRDNLDLHNGEYVVLLRGESVGRGQVQPRAHLALDPGTATGRVEGIETTDPVFGLPAFWILDRTVLDAQAKGYTVVDTPTVLTTHLVELMASYGHELYDGAQLDAALERIQATHPKLVDDLVPELLSRSALLKIFRNLLKEGLSIRDTQTILEALTEFAPRSRDPDVLTEFARQRMARHITGRFASDGVVRIVQLGPRAEDALLRGLQSADGGAPSLQLPPEQARRIILGIRDQIERYAGPGQAVVLCPPLARGALRRMLERALPRVTVLSSAELLPEVQVQPVGQVELQPA